MKKERGKSRLFDSMASASAAMGVSKDVLKAAKEKGCPAFKGSRVDEKSFRDWFKAHASELQSACQKSSLRDQKISEEIRKLKNANDRAEGKLQDAAKEGEWLGKIMGEARAVLEQKLVNEYPAMVQQLEAPAIRARGKQLFDEIMSKLNPLAKKAAAQTPKPETQGAA